MLRTAAAVRPHVRQVTARRFLTIVSAGDPTLKPRWMGIDEAVSVIASDNTVFVHGAAATPTPLINAMARHGLRAGLKNVKVVHIHTEGELAHLKPECKGVFRDNSFFMGANVRDAVNAGLADYTPAFLSEIPRFFRRGTIPLDVALVNVSPPDEHGFCTLGVSVDIAVAACHSAKHIVAMVNSKMPRTHGDGVISVRDPRVRLVEHDHPLPQHPPAPLAPEEIAIGKLIAENLVGDRATMQMGIGSIPDAVLAALRNHKDLGIHSEMFSDGLVDLLATGAVTNRYKKHHNGQIVGGFCVGSDKVYRMIDDNPSVVMRDIEWVNDPYVIAQNDNVVAINSCIEIDLTGQVVSDSIGKRFFSGVGGQLDFVRGASLSQNGKPIMALPSITSKGESRIVPSIKQYGGVVTTRAHVHYVVTEHGIAELHGKSVIERARALIAIAHPSQRKALTDAAIERFGTL